MVCFWFNARFQQFSVIYRLEVYLTIVPGWKPVNLTIVPWWKPVLDTNLRQKLPTVSHKEEHGRTRARTHDLIISERSVVYLSATLTTPSRRRYDRGGMIDKRSVQLNVYVMLLEFHEKVNIWLECPDI